MIEFLKTLDTQEVGACILMLPFFFAMEMSAADSLCRVDLITLETQQRLAGVSVFKIPIVGFLAIFLPPVGFVLFVITTIISIAAVAYGYFAWKKVVKGARK